MYLGLLSINDIVITCARTGRDSSSNRADIAIDHTNCGIRSGFILLRFIFIVVIKFSASRMDLLLDVGRRKLDLQMPAHVQFLLQEEDK
jgi:hypothetical protein